MSKGIVLYICCMIQQKIAFIINPVAGRRKVRNLEGKIINRLNKDIWDAWIYYTQYQGHATQLSIEAYQNGCHTIVAVGGDGTVNEIATACVKLKATLGIIPLGSGNGLARELKIPLLLKRAINQLNSAERRTIDVGALNEHYFFCTCGTGFDATIGHKFAKMPKRGFSTYVKTTLREFFGYRPKKYKVKIDGEKLERKAFLVTIANAGQYGNNAYISPNSKIDDGFLDVCLFKPFPWYKAPILGIRLFSSSMDKSKYLEIIRAKKMFIQRKKKLKFHIDGEPITLKGKVKIQVLPQALNVISPGTNGLEG